MAKGVKKIKWTGKGKVISSLSVPNKKVGIEAGQDVSFEIESWYEGTTEDEKKKSLTWILQDRKKQTIIAQRIQASNLPKNISIPKELCGPFEYYLEASLGGKRDLHNETGLYISGSAPAKLVSSKWCKAYKGEDVRKTYFFSYGENVYLNLKTEGLNGHQNIQIEIFRHLDFKTDPVIRKIVCVDVIDGEINLEIKNTYAWYSTIKGIKETEEFYVKIYDPVAKVYITDEKGLIDHATFLRINKKVVSHQVTPPTSLSPLKTGEPDKNKERYELCKFETITITEPKKQPIKLFNNGQNLSKITNPKTPIFKTILFDFEKHDITPEAKTTLNNVLQYLLESQHSYIKIDGHACVIGKEQYNQKLSQQRSDAVKKVFVDGGLDAGRIVSIGRGEVNPTDDKKGRDNLKHKDEKEYKENRRVDITFDSYGHDAQTIIYETIAPSHEENFTIDITEYQNKACFREKGKHKKNIKINSTEYSKPIDQVTNKLDFPVKSNLSQFNLFPFKYIWPKVFANEYNIHVHSCRYFSVDSHTTLKVMAYPDIKWELALEFLVNVSNYKAANMPTGNIFAKHQEKARDAGYKRWLMNKEGKVPIEVGVRLSAKWDNELHKREYTQLFEEKIESIAKMIAKSTDLLQNAINYTQSASKSSAFPVAFDIRYPK
jgi:outer membrane protein OmpA-like peptidoglycan-associated protein